jgi:hypothetical protein
MNVGQALGLSLTIIGASIFGGLIAHYGAPLYGVDMMVALTPWLAIGGGAAMLITSAVKSN